MKTAALAVALTISPTSDFEIERLCMAQAVRIWDIETVTNTEPDSADAEAAQHFMAGCRAGARAASPRPLETAPAPVVRRRADGWGGLLDGR